MVSFSFEDEDKSITWAFPEGPPSQILMSKDGERTPPTGFLVVVEIQTAPVECWCHWAVDFPLRRESVLA
jgi:hypothetical protein